MLHELWDDPESDGTYTFCLAGPHGDDARSMLSPSARLTWTVEAKSHFEAMTLYWERQGWGKYTTDQAWDYVSYSEHGWEHPDAVDTPGAHDDPATPGTSRRT